MKNIIFFLIIFSVIGCGINKYPFWDDLHPFSKNIHRAIRTAKNYFKDSNNRKNAFDFLQEYLGHSYIFKGNQYRLCTIAEILIFSSEGKDERLTLFKLIEKGQEHREFLGCFFMGGYSTAPPFISLTINKIHNDGNFYAYIPNPDSGKIEKTYLKKYIIHDLEKVSGYSFGNYFTKWKKWWETEGQFLDYDWENNKYIYTVEDNKAAMFSEESRSSDEHDSELDKKGDNPAPTPKEEDGKLIVLGYM